MQSLPDQTKIKNLLLRSLAPNDFALLAPNLTTLDFPIRKPLVEPLVPIETVWFIEAGIASMVSTSPEGHQSESGFVGRCGFVDVAVLLGTNCTPIQCYIQVAGHGFSMPAAALRQACTASTDLHHLFLRYAQALLIQIAQTSLTNAAHSTEERLARWLLMCFDRVDGDDVPLTHEFISLMLNVRRPGVTMALGSLAAAGLIKTRRGVVTLIDHAGLRDLANDSYGVPEAEYERLIGAKLMRSI
jgi:CRP-like cAMP-binding protein